MATMHYGASGPAKGTWGHRAQDWITLILGAWLFVTPWVLGDSGHMQSSVDAWIVGALIFLVSAWALSWPAVNGIERLNTLLAIWLFITPFWMDGVMSEKIDSWCVAVVVFCLSLYAAAVAPRPTNPG